MSDEEFNQAKAFLNNKQTPTPDDILNLFFFDDKNYLEAMGSEIEPDNVDFDLLGEADEVRTEKGTEWIVTRLLWDTPEGLICKINLIRADVSMSDGIFAVKPMFPYGEQTIDIDYEEVIPPSFEELLEDAIENEDFEEAARLRDWDKNLKEMLLAIKPKILKAIKDANVKKLDELLTQIRVYRNTL